MRISFSINSSLKNNSEHQGGSKSKCFDKCKIWTDTESNNIY